MSDEPKIHQRSRPRQGSADVEQMDVDRDVARKNLALVEQAIETSLAQAEAGGGGPHAPSPADDAGATASPHQRGGKIAGTADGEYEVGYGKPPKQTRFKKGTSGNPKGRPKASKSVKAHVREMLLRPVTISWAGKPVTMPSIMVSYEQWMQKAMKGDSKALAELHKLAVQFGIFDDEGDKAEGGAAGETSVSDSDMRAYAALQFDQMLTAGLSEGAAFKAFHALGLGQFLPDVGAGTEGEK